MNRETRRKTKKPQTMRAPSGVTRQRILWASNAPFTATGYGVQTAQVVTRLVDDGHEVAIACNYGLQGAETSWNNRVKMYPTGASAYSDDILRAHAQHWMHESDLPGVVIPLFDVWALENPTVAQIPKIAAWAPIDHQPAPPKVLSWLKRPNVLPIAMSQFASTLLRDDGIDHVYVPHAVEKVFAPTESFADADGTRVTGRQLMGVSHDRFVVLMNAANKGRTPVRKCFGENLLAFAIFASRHPDAYLHLHTDVSAALSGIDMGELVKACGLKREQFGFVDQYLLRSNLPQQALAAVYSAADVLLATSAGEGFGVPVIEAQACGTPAIVSDWTAQSELTGNGWAVPVQPLWDPFQASWFATPMIASIVDALEEAYARPRGVCAASVEFARAYDADRVFTEYWRPALETIAEWPGLERRTAKPTQIRDDLKKSESPTLTLYVPTFQREELRTLLESIAGQWCERVEVVVSDNDPDGSAEAIVSEVLGSAAEYSRRLTNIGGDANILRGIMAGRGEYVWIIGDDDVLLPGALADTLAIIDAEHPDRIIHWDENALQLVPAGHSGTMRSLIEELGDDTSLLIASTLITANVYKRAILDPTLGHAMIETCYGHVYAGMEAETVHVNEWPRLVVGCDHPGHIDGYEEIYARLLEAITDKAGTPGIPLENALRWNYVSLALAQR